MLKYLLLALALGWAVLADAQETPPEPGQPALATTAEEALAAAEEAARKTNFRLALEYYTQALALDTTSVAALLGRARAAAEVGQYEQVIEDTTLVLAVQPQDVLARTLNGFALALTTSPEDGLKLLESARDDNPESAVPLNYLGIHAVLTGDLAGALAYFDEAIALAPQQALPLNSRAVVHARRGNLEAALADMTAALALEPASALLLTNRGSLLRASGDMAGALNDLNSALAHDPAYAQAYFERALVYVSQGQQNIAQIRAYYTSAIDDLNAYLTTIHPLDLNPQAALYRDQLSASLASLP
jgi:Tfp pilus assembly protein PilF